ncbi:hypothetical protein D3C86_1383680 [compost metagenome]
MCTRSIPTLLKSKSELAEKGATFASLLLCLKNRFLSTSNITAVAVNVAGSLKAITKGAALKLVDSPLTRLIGVP